MKNMREQKGVWTEDVLKKEAMTILEMSVEELKRWGSLTPKAMFFLSNGEKVVSFLEFSNKKEKVGVAHRIIDFARESKAEAMMIVSDCFFSEDLDRPPSHSKNCKQAIYLSCESAHGNFALLQEYECDQNNRVVLGKIAEWPAGAEDGLFANMLAA